MNCFAKEFLEQLCALIISMYFCTKSPSFMWFRGSETNFNFPAVYKFHPMVYIQLYQHEWKLEKREIPIFTSVDIKITVYQYGKNVSYIFYNIAQRTLTKKWREIFRVDIELYQHGSNAIL